MKKLFKTIAIALVATVVTFNANADDKKIAYRESKLNVGMYEAGAAKSLILNVMVTKNDDAKARVKLMDAEGNTIYTETISKKAGSHKLSLDMSNAPKGKYYLEIVNGASILTKEINREADSLKY